MNIWIGTDLAADILGSVKDTPGDKVAQVIVKNANEPYYKGICSDAKRCGVEIITAEKLVHNCTYPTISLNPYIRVPDAINLDGGYLTPCTAEASMRLLRRYGFIFQGADVLLLGRSERVGEPLSHLLTRANATVTIAHSLTKSSSIWRLAQNADLIISSVGRADFTELELKPTATVVDIGGDFVGISGIQNYVPFIGGVGPVTRAILMEHILKFRRFKEDKKTMLKIENTEVMGWEHAIRGMRNPKNSWEKSDSNWRYIAPAQRENHILASYSDDSEFWIGPNDADLMNRLRNAGTDHRKFMRMITVYLDITAPLYWWKEFKTYRAGKRFGDDEPDIIDDGYLEYDIEMNSCSTMHKIADKEFTLDDFSHEHLNCEPYHRNWIESATVGEDITSPHKVWMTPLDILRCTIEMLNAYRESYLETKDKQDWWQMIQLLPSSYNQRRTVMLNYEVLANMYKSRRNHKLDEWHTFCDWIESLPYSELITGKGNSAPENSYCSGRR